MISGYEFRELFLWRLHKTYRQSSLHLKFSKNLLQFFIKHSWKSFIKIYFQVFLNFHFYHLPMNHKKSSILHHFNFPKESLNVISRHSRASHKILRFYLFFCRCSTPIFAPLSLWLFLKMQQKNLPLDEFVSPVAHLLLLNVVIIRFTFWLHNKTEKRQF